MDEFMLIEDTIDRHDWLAEWPEMGALFHKIIAARPRHWRLPALACQAASGTLDQAAPALTANACFHISIILVDDLLDDDPRGEHNRIGAPMVANLALAFAATGMRLIASSDLEPTLRLVALAEAAQMLYTTALGQSLDMQNPSTEEGYWRLVEMKSAPFFCTAFYLGGLFGEIDPQTAPQLKHLGRLYGEIIQIHDDLGDALDTPANPDWLLGRASLPILFAESVHHPQQARFIDLRRAIPLAETLAEAQSILLQCGAISYGIQQILQRYQDASDLLATMTLPSANVLQSLLDDLVRPIEVMFEQLSAHSISIQVDQNRTLDSAKRTLVCYREW